MKSSKYNICLPYEKKYVIFNGITKRFFFVSSHNKEAFMQILSAPNDYIGEYAPFLKRMADEGFIVEDSVDELEVIKQQYESMNNSDYYHLMILPTYACNVSCWYCTQHHRNMHLNDADVERVKKHIAYYLTEHHLKGLHLSWFGGEPLLDFHRIVEISVFAMQFCKEHDMTFKNTITTNGILLSKEYLEKMKELNFTFFQITVDGIQEEHDKVKVIKGKSAYKTTLGNICMIAEIIPSAEICLRYNYTTNNLSPNAFLDDLCSLLPENIRKHIHLSLIKVWQEDEKNIDNDKLEKLVSSAINKQFYVSVGQNFLPCYVENHNYNTIFPNGKVGKCDNLDPEQAQGRILNSGEILWEKEIPFEHYSIFDGKEKECLSCLYLPICYGPCPKERDDAYQRGAHLVCRFQDSDRLWRQNILYYCIKHLHILLILFLPFIASAQSNDSIYKKIDLQDVVIIGDNVVHYPDKDVIVITDSLRKGTYSVKEMMNSLPCFLYNPISRSLSFHGSSSILFLIDGKEKRSGYAGELSHQRFDKIEILKDPVGKYEGYDMVINLITKDNWRGYDVNINNMEVSQPSAPDNNLITLTHSDLTYSYIMPKYDIAFKYDMSHSNSHNSYDYYEKTSIYEESVIPSGTPTSIRFSNRHDAWIDMGYQIAKGHSLSFMYDYKMSHSNSYTHKYVERKVFTGGDSYINEDSKTHNNNGDHTFTLNYSGRQNNWEFSSELTFEKYQAKQTNRYLEDGTELYNTPFKNCKDFFLGDFSVTKRFGKKYSLNMEYMNVYKKYQSESNASLSRSKEHRNILFMAFSYSPTSQLSLRIGGNIRNVRKSYDDSGRSNDNLVNLNGRVYYRMSRSRNLEVTYSWKVTHPSLFHTNGNGRWVNTQIYAVGNPSLESSTTKHVARINLYIRPVSFHVEYDHSGNSISPVYKKENGITIQTYDNVRSSMFNSGLNISHGIRLWGGTLNMTGSVDYELLTTRYQGVTKRCGYWTGNGMLTFFKNKFPTLALMYANYAHTVVTPQGNSIVGPDTWTLSVSHNMFNNRLMGTLSYQLPIAWKNKVNKTVTQTSYYESVQTYNAYAYSRNTIILTLMYRFYKGKQKSRKKTSQTTESEQQTNNNEL